MPESTKTSLQIVTFLILIFGGIYYLWNKPYQEIKKYNDYITEHEIITCFHNTKYYDINPDDYIIRKLDFDAKLTPKDITKPLFDFDLTECNYDSE